MPFKAILTTALVLAGACAIGYGLWLAYQPAAYVFGGVCLIWAAYEVEVGGRR